MASCQAASDERIELRICTLAGAEIKEKSERARSTLHWRSDMDLAKSICFVVGVIFVLLVSGVIRCLDGRSARRHGFGPSSPIISLNLRDKVSRTKGLYLRSALVPPREPASHENG